MSVSHDEAKSIDKGHVVSFQDPKQHYTVTAVENHPATGAVTRLALKRKHDGYVTEATANDFDVMNIMGQQEKGNNVAGGTKATKPAKSRSPRKK